MINFNIIYVDSKNCKNILVLEDEYIRKISKYAKINRIAVSKINISDESSVSEIAKSKVLEADLIRKKIKGYVIALDLSGKQMSSEDLSIRIKNLMLSGSGTISFIIGGPNGLSPFLINECDKVISLSKLTFPHHLARLILIEQLYRSMCILNGKTYHR